jgi:hypothetical protein
VGADERGHARVGAVQQFVEQEERRNGPTATIRDLADAS